jgi:hypothetical protein
MLSKALFASTAILAASVSAQDESPFAPLRTQANWEIGQIEQGFYEDETRNVDREPISHAAVWALQEIKLAEHARAFMGVGAAYFYVFPRNLGANPYVWSKRSGVGLTDAHGEFGFMPQDDGGYGLLLKAGIFPYKYNPDAKNLGEYMFRTWTYPTVITTGGLEFVNSAGTQLSGFAANSRIGTFENDILLTIQSDRVPIMGLSISDIMSYRLGILTLGAGYMFDNIYSPEDRHLTPKEKVLNRWYQLSDGRKMSGKEKVDLEDQGQFPATVTVVDSGFYTFAGQKAMVRGALDFGRLFNTSLMSEHDLRLYFEAILLGVKDYPVFYEKKADRTVYMAGLNIPTFGLLDLLSAEVEYCSNPYRNSTQGPLSDGAAVPRLYNMYPTLPEKVDEDDWKWTVYAKKQVYEKFAVHAQVANDHIRMLDVFSVPYSREFLTQKNHWYWVFKLSYSL